MYTTYEAHSGMNLKVPGSWRSRIVVILALVVGYAALLYGLVHTRTSRTQANGLPMLTPVISEVGARRGDVVTARAAPIGPEDDSAPPAVHWIFPAIDVWPSPPGWYATLSEFTPVTDARPDPRDAQVQYRRDGRQADRSRARHSALRMVGWLRPPYPVELAAAGVQGSVTLDLLIDARGQPIEVLLAKSSGSSELDNATLHAANSWRFSPPRFKSQPTEVWGRVEVRYQPAAAISK